MKGNMTPLIERIKDLEAEVEHYRTMLGLKQIT